MDMSAADSQQVEKSLSKAFIRAFLQQIHGQAIWTYV